MKSEDDYMHHLYAGVIWGFLGILFSVTGVGFLVFDLFLRWGYPLVLEWSIPTLIWMVSFLLSRAAQWRMEREADTLLGKPKGN